MKKFLITTVFITLITFVIAQAPQGISHQAVIRNAANELVASTTLDITVSIIHESPNGAVIYSESHSKATNSNGLVTFVIGKGNVISGNFASIVWAFGPHFIKTEANVPGAKTYTITGISEVFTVPHAFHAGSLTLTSPGGNHFKITVDDNGNLITTEISGICPPTVTDIDGNVYNTILIGDQCWMAENLNIGTRINGTNNQTNSGTIEKYCINNLESNCNIYGGLYQWDEMMQYTTTEGVQGICPVGWHLPGDAEWTALTTYVSSQQTYLCNSNSNWIAKSLAATILWNTHSNTCAIGNNLAANNATGFSGLPGGYRGTIGTFDFINTNGYWWSSSEYSTTDAWTRHLYTYNSSVNNYYNIKAYGFSVRCLRNN